MSRTAPSRSSGYLLLAIVLAIVVLLALFLLLRKGAGRHADEPGAVPLSGRLELPAARNGDAPLPHHGYTVGFRSDYHQAAWVAYLLTAAEVREAKAPRTNNFRVDPAIPEGGADGSDYEGSGYDRGHLAPAEDLSYSPRSMSESFYYSNMSPQVPAFNRGVWKRLEELVRYWAAIYDSLYIVSGPVLEPELHVIGPHQLPVPQEYYKVVLQYGQHGVKGIGFLLRNEPSAATLRSFAVPIDSVERITGIDFYPRLPDDQEVQIERSVDLEKWRWTRKKEPAY
ncbi:DNA/RNA non-specific endonuclease [Flaviaesturariibacter terrae]